MPKAERGGQYGGVPVWWAPTTDEEADLPQLTGSGLPEQIDLSEIAGEVPVGMRAAGLFQLWGEQPGQVVVVGADGASYSLDVSRLEPVTDGGGLRPPVTQESLSPDGRYAFFVQERSLEVYDFDRATWTTIPAEQRWTVESAEWADDRRHAQGRCRCRLRRLLTASTHPTAQTSDPRPTLSSMSESAAATTPTDRSGATGRAEPAACTWPGR